MFLFKDCILVTGAAGFIGSHFCKRWVELHPDCLVVALDKTPDQFAMNLFPQFEQTEFSYGDLIQTREEILEVSMTTRSHVFCVKGDIGNRTIVNAIFQQLKPSKVFNFAAESHVDKSIDDAAPFLESNVLGLGVLLSSFKEHMGLYKMKPKFIQISTDEVYGDYGSDGAKTEAEMEAGYLEGSHLRPSSPYAASKAAGDLLVQSFARTFGISWVITRSANNFGPRQAPEKLIPLMITKAMGGKPLPVYGDGNQFRDWIYVFDNVDGIITAAQNGRDEVFNIGSGIRQENLGVVRHIQDQFDKGSKIEFVKDRPGHDRMYRINSDKLRNDMGWEPQFKFLDALDETIQWYRDNPNWIASMINIGYTTDRVGTGSE